jgi:uncharacterized membrane protein YeaQ/YmgE (transglycosylase-associated protein family)
MIFMLFVSALVNVMAWIAIGYIAAGYFAKYSRCGMLCSVSAGVAGSLLGGLTAFLAYGFPDTLLWANNLLFAIVGSLGLVYISLPEKERSIKVEQMVRSVKKINRLYIDLAGLKR